MSTTSQVTVSKEDVETADKIVQYLSMHRGTAVALAIDSQYSGLPPARLSFPVESGQGEMVPCTLEFKDNGGSLSVRITAGTWIQTHYADFKPALQDYFGVSNYTVVRSTCKGDCTCQPHHVMAIEIEIPLECFIG